MKNMDTSTRIEKAIERLRQRYGVSGGLTTELKVIAVQNGLKAYHDLNSMKIFEDLKTFGIFAFLRDEVDKFSGQLLLNTISRLLVTLKRRYLDSSKKKLDLSRPLSLIRSKISLSMKLKQCSQTTCKHFLALIPKKL